MIVKGDEVCRLRQVLKTMGVIHCVWTLELESGWFRCMKMATKFYVTRDIRPGHCD